MFRNLFMWILKLFNIKSETNNKEIEDNERYAIAYEDINNINFNAIFSNKLANYVANDSEIEFTKENPRSELLSMTGNSMWKKIKKIVSMALGNGGVIIVPYVKGGKIFYNLVPQSRLTIDETDGDTIIAATVLAEKRVITNDLNKEIYIRWTNYKVENGNITIRQEFSDEQGNKIPVPSFWENIQEEQVITGVDRVLFGYIKSPVNNRRQNDKYGVPITYGCEETIKEIRECMAQIQREYELKEAFVGVDSTMFNGNNKLPLNGLFKKIDSGEDNFFEVFDPQFRDYSNRLQELYKRLEHEVGTSYGILSEVTTTNATATEIKRSLYDTFTIVDDTRANLEKGLEDFFYACNVLANAYNLSPMGEYEVSYNWSYSLIEDPSEEFNQLTKGESLGVISKAEVRQWIKPDETIEEAEEKIKEIEEQEPTVESLIGK